MRRLLAGIALAAAGLLAHDGRAAAAPDAGARNAVEARFAADARSQALALSLFDAYGDVADTLPAQAFDGGYRGIIRLVPALPVGADRKHLEWVAAALRDFDAFFAIVSAHGTLRYRWRDLSLQFFRSVGNTTPNAFAWAGTSAWDVAYNVRGSLDTTPDAVRETLFHEIFHLDDVDHGDWSMSHLAALQDTIERRCGGRLACLAPYAPTATIVRRGTYYAFQRGNDAREYAAEVATRYYVENRAAATGSGSRTATTPPFKCGPAENRLAWDAIKAEFFGGVDLVPACPATSPN